MDMIEKVRSTLGTYDGNDVRALLKADHDVLRELAQQLADAGSSPQRRSLLGKLKPLLVAHSRAEEQSVYVPLTQVRDSPDARLAGSEGAVEHFLADTVLARLDAAHDASTDMWRAHAKVLHEMLEHHIKEEESDVFEALGEHFSADERSAMAANFARLRDERLAAETGSTRKGNGQAARKPRAASDAGRVRRTHAA